MYNHIHIHTYNISEWEETLILKEQARKGIWKGQWREKRGGGCNYAVISKIKAVI